MNAPQPSHLAHQVAGIAADLRSRAPGAGPRAMLLALIQACLLRIFTRLETLLALWQAGQLPQPIARPQTAQTSRAQTAPPSHRRAAPTGPRRRVPVASMPTKSRPDAATPHPAHARQPTAQPIHPAAPMRAATLRHRTAFPLDPRPE